MHRYTAKIDWAREGDDFGRGRYSRVHAWRFDGGIEVAASPSPDMVPAPWSNPANVDPEEAFVASVASCHLLTFLFIAAKAGFAVHSYEDQAEGVMTKNATGRLWVSQVTLHPKIEWQGDRVPSAAELEQLHETVHAECFIANSVRTEIRVETQP